MKNAVILLSGGLDSATCLAIAQQEGYQCFSLTMNYGQHHQAELHAAQQIAQQAKVAHHEVLALSMGHLLSSALTNKADSIPDYTKSKAIPVTYVPARNTIFLSIALGWAEALSAEAIFIGVSAVDYSNYPDCRPEYIESFQKTVALATKAGLEGQVITIRTPLIHLSKAETMNMGRKLGVDYSQTISCYQATEDGLACGRCDSCYLRRKGFEAAKIADPTRYQSLYFES